MISPQVRGGGGQDRFFPTFFGHWQTSRTVLGELIFCLWQTCWQDSDPVEVIPQPRNEVYYLLGCAAVTTCALHAHVQVHGSDTNVL